MRSSEYMSPTLHIFPGIAGGGREGDGGGGKGGDKGGGDCDGGGVDGLLFLQQHLHNRESDSIKHTCPVRLVPVNPHSDLQSWSQRRQSRVLYRRSSEYISPTLHMFPGVVGGEGDGWGGGNGDGGGGDGDGGGRAGLLFLQQHLHNSEPVSNAHTCLAIVVPIDPHSVLHSTRQRWHSRVSKSRSSE